MCHHKHISFVKTNLSECVSFLTLEVPWLDFVEVDLSDYVEIDSLRLDFLLEVVIHELLVSRMESESWRDLCLCSVAHLSNQSNLAPVRP